MSKENEQIYEQAAQAKSDINNLAKSASSAATGIVKGVFSFGTGVLESVAEGVVGEEKVSKIKQKAKGLADREEKPIRQIKNIKERAQEEEESVNKLKQELNMEVN